MRNTITLILGLMLSITFLNAQNIEIHTSDQKKEDNQRNETWISMKDYYKILGIEMVGHYNGQNTNNPILTLKTINCL